MSENASKEVHEAVIEDAPPAEPGVLSSLSNLAHALAPVGDIADMVTGGDHAFGGRARMLGDGLAAAEPALTKATKQVKRAAQKVGEQVTGIAESARKAGLISDGSPRMMPWMVSGKARAK